MIFFSSINDKFSTLWRLSTFKYERAKPDLAKKFYSISFRTKGRSRDWNCSVTASLGTTGAAPESLLRAPGDCVWGVFGTLNWHFWRVAQTLLVPRWAVVRWGWLQVGTDRKWWTSLPMKIKNPPVLPLPSLLQSSRTHLWLQFRRSLLHWVLHVLSWFRGFWSS